MSIQLKRSTTATIDSSYVLQEGQIGIEMRSATNQNNESASWKFKIGDGQTPWSSLPYATYTPSEVDTAFLKPTGNAASATKLATARNIQVNLGSSSAASFNGTANVTPGVTGTLPIAKGGTGVTTLDALKTALGVSSSGGGLFELTSGNLNDPTYTWSGSTKTGTLTFNLPTQWTINLLEFNTRSSTAGLVITSNYNGSRGGGIEIAVSNLYPCSNAYGTYTTLGSSSTPWNAIYSKSGSVQTSSREVKHDIVYIDDAESSTVSDLVDTQVDELISLSDILEFISQLRPATFCYNQPEGVQPIDKQLGLIAEDVSSLKCFNFIGVQYNESDGVVLGLQPIPLAVAALTACKYLLQRVEILEEKLIA